MKYINLNSLLGLIFIFGLGAYTWSIPSKSFALSSSSAAKVTYNIKYGAAKTQSGFNQTLLMDIYEPADYKGEKRPLIVLAHGGYFLFGDKKEFDKEARELVKSGYVVASINYRLIDVEESDTAAKKAVIDAVHDMKAAVRFFAKDAKSDDNYKIDPNRIVIGGYSAGAVTVLHYAYANTPNDVLLMGGEWLLNYVLKTGGLEGQSGNPGQLSTVKGVINFAGSIHQASLVDPNEPFLVSVHGTDDVVVPFTTGTTGTTAVITEGSGLIHKRADEIGLSNLLIKIEGGDHLVRYTCVDCIERIRKFLKSNL